MILRKVTPSDYQFLYELVAEKTPEQNISHEKMPTYEEHVAFNDAKPYKEDWIIGDNQGRVYITHNNEIGIHIKMEHRGKGLAGEVIEMLKSKIDKLYANISPLNEKSIKLFTKHGFKPYQITLRYKLNDTRGNNTGN